MVSDLISAMDVWLAANEILESLPWDDRHGLSSRDTFWNLSIERTDDEDPAMLSSSVNVRIHGTGDLRWALTIFIHKEKARIIAELWLDHSLPKLLREIASIDAYSQQSLVNAVQEASKYLVDDFIASAKKESMADLWQRHRPAELRDL